MVKKDRSINGALNGNVTNLKKTHGNHEWLIVVIRCLVAFCAVVNAGLFCHLMRQSNRPLINQFRNQLLNFARSTFNITNIFGQSGSTSELSQIKYWDNSSNLTVVTNSFHKIVTFPDELSYQNEEQQHDARSPAIFIIGYPRSGITLTRMILDAHPLVNCGGETKAIGGMLDFSSSFFYKGQRSAIENAGITENTLRAANRAFILEIMARQNNPSQVLCNRDGNMARHMPSLAAMFPNSKFVWLIRDPRAAVKSMMSKNMTMPGLDPENMTMPFEVWEEFHNATLKECRMIGKSRCYMLYYERLVTYPEFELRRLMAFLELPWAEQMMHHQDFIGDSIPFPKAEFNIDTISRPIFNTSVRDFKLFFPRKLRRKLKRVVPHMQILGYEKKFVNLDLWELGNLDCNRTEFQDLMPWVVFKGKGLATGDVPLETAG